MKACFKCGYEKPLESFYKHKMMADGRLNKCIDCTKKDVSLNLSKKAEDPVFLEKERARGRDKFKRLYRGIKQDPAIKAKAMQSYKQRYPEKAAAKNKSQRLVFEKGIEKHHWSYKEEHALNVIPLTTSDHNLLHRYIKYDQSTKMYRLAGSGEMLDSKLSHIVVLFMALIAENEILPKLYPKAYKMA